MFHSGQVSRSVRSAKTLAAGALMGVVVWAVNTDSGFGGGKRGGENIVRKEIQEGSACVDGVDTSTL